MKKIQQLNESLQSDLLRTREELTESLEQCRKHESRFENLENVLKEQKNKLDEFYSQSQEQSYKLQMTELAALEKEKELRAQFEEINRQLKQEQNAHSQLKFDLTEKEDTINRMGQDTDQLVQ